MQSYKDECISLLLCWKLLSGNESCRKFLVYGQTYMKIRGVWMNLYRAADKESNTLDFLLTKKRNKRAALLYQMRQSRYKGLPGLLILTRK